MKRSAALGFALLGALGASAGAEQTGKTYRVGILSGDTLASARPTVDAFRRTLSSLGYQEGKNLEILYRFTGGGLKRLPEVAAELVEAKPDVIVANGTPVIAAAKHATTSIPIVMTITPDPVGSGFIASLSRPDGNITGMADMNAELTGKRLQLLKELEPNLRRVAVLRDPANPGNLIQWREAEKVARPIGIQVFAIDLGSPDQIDPAFKRIPQLRTDAILVLGGAVTTSYAARVVQLIAEQRLPAVYSQSFYTADGGLMSYGFPPIATWRQAATYVDRILKGANPADLPVERPTTFELIVNLKTARNIGITVPQSILLRADQVIR